MIKAVHEDEFSAVERPFLEQLALQQWTTLELSRQQKPSDSFREDFDEVLLLPELRKALQKINDWLEPDQIEEVIGKLRINAEDLQHNLVRRNQKVLNLLLQSVTVSENRKTGESSPLVRFIDFEPSGKENNRWLAVSQLKIRVPGTDNHVFPDIILYLNGLPMGLVECKSPKANAPVSEAIDQLMRYGNFRESSHREGVPLLFAYNQVLIATCRNVAKFGSISCQSEKYFYRWTDPYPLTLEELSTQLGKQDKNPNDQERLVAGMLSKENFLSLLRTFTVFQEDKRDGTLRKVVGRYQQFRAVKKSIRRLETGLNPEERGGILWHTQGSGKSLTMMFMVREMTHHPELKKWKVVFVTDRTQLETQLSDTSITLGYEVKLADSIAKLQSLLKHDTNDLVMAMIQKFQESEFDVTFPRLNASSKILVMTDEAHRTQYSKLGSNLRYSMPNATHIGYTGTPIDKTRRTYGGYIDTYSMRQSIDDGVTLAIVYEGRTLKSEVFERSEMDRKFLDVFVDYEPEQLQKIIGYKTREAYLEAEPVIAEKAEDMINHYVEEVFPNGFKAQVVAVTRVAAVRYQHKLTKALAVKLEQLRISNPNGINLEMLEKIKVQTIISGNHNDLEYIKEFTDSGKHREAESSFKAPFELKSGKLEGEVAILVVQNMLLTGFDAPVEQVLYLDRTIQAHNLLQAITRVNRVYNEDKTHGFIVDYAGIGHHLKEALDNYDEEERKEIEGTITDSARELEDLKIAQKNLLDFFNRYGITDFSDLDAFFDLFYDENTRFEYVQLFNAFSKAMDALFPRKEAAEYLGTLKTFSSINEKAKLHFRNDRYLSFSTISAKLRPIIEAHLGSQGINQKIEPIELLSEEFDRELARRKRSKTKAAEIEHAIRHHIDVHIDEDPELYTSLAQALEAILVAHADNWDVIEEALRAFREHIRSKELEQTYGLHRKKEMPFYRMFRKELLGLENDIALKVEQIDALVMLTAELVEELVAELSLKAFWEGQTNSNRLRVKIKDLLVSNPEYVKALPSLKAKAKELVAKIMEMAFKLNDTLKHG